MRFGDNLVEISYSLNELQKLKPELGSKLQLELSSILDKVISLILEKMFIFEKAKYKNEQIHYLLKEDMQFELAKLISFISGIVVKDGIKNINFLDFNIEEENEKYFNDAGLIKINNTASELFINIWDKQYLIWVHKTKNLLQKEQNKEVQKTRNPSVVNINHFITKSFIKDYWSNNELKVNLVTKKSFKNKYCSYGKFGHQSNIYSDRLEDFFSLLEGDAKQPLKKLINLVPINRLEKEAIVAFIMIHYLRNPYHFKLKFEELFCELPNVKEYTKTNNSYLYIYETIFKNNELYGILTKNILRNKWVLLNSEEKLFILPDTALYYNQKNDGQIIVFPISPKKCLIILNEEDLRLEALRSITKSKSLTINQSMIFSKFLIDISAKNMLVDKNFFNYQDEILSTTSYIENIIQIISDNESMN